MLLHQTVGAIETEVQSTQMHLSVSRRTDGWSHRKYAAAAAPH